MRLCSVNNQCYACRCTNSLVLKMDTLGLRNRKSKYKKTNVVRYDRCVEGGGGCCYTVWTNIMLVPLH